MKLKSVLFIFLAFLLVFGGCKEEEEGDESSNVYYYGGTSSPGDVWEWELNHSDKTFVGNFKESGHEFSISGSYVDLAYGFKKGTVNEVNNTSGTSDVPSPGDTGYFVEVPGLALAIHPNDDDSHSILAVGKKVDCSDIEGSYNFLRVSFYDVDERDEYGTATLSISGSSVTVNGTEKKISNSSYSDTINETGSCDAGKFTLNSGATGYASGYGIVLDFGSGEGGIIAFKQQSDISLDDIRAKSYAGVVYRLSDENSDGHYDDEDAFPVKLDFGTDGTGKGYEITNIETGAVDSSNAVSISLSSIDNGLVSGTLTDNGTGNTYNLKGIAYKKDDRIVLVLLVDRGGDVEVAFLVSL